VSKCIIYISNELGGGPGVETDTDSQEFVPLQWQECIFCITIGQTNFQASAHYIIWFCREDERGQSVEVADKM